MYVAVGVFVVFIKTGTPSMPNAVFWASHYDAITTAITWIRHCGTTSSEKL
jgi:hypothetical protein